jgi:hypothetical protein
MKGKHYIAQSSADCAKAEGLTSPLPKDLTWVSVDGLGEHMAIEVVGQAAQASVSSSAIISTVRPGLSPIMESSHMTLTRGEPNADEEVIELPMLMPCVEMIDAKTRHLFSHFADYVSPVMVLVDGISNGYRYHILPLAVNDVIVQRAVCVASAFHLSIQQPELRLPAEAGRAAIITKLKHMAATEQVLTHSTWATIVLLFVGELITGSDNILTLYRMLMSFVNARGAEAAMSPLADFLNQQTRIIEFFTRPAISEIDGVEKLFATPSPETGGMEWPNPPVFTSLYYNEAYRQASAIYILRAQSEHIIIDDPLAIKLVARLKDLLTDVDPYSAGAHTLVWPYFVAAAESILPVHRTFFYQRLNHIWETTRYRNIKVAIDALDRIWARRGEERWTAMLPDIAMVIM